MIETEITQQSNNTLSRMREVVDKFVDVFRDPNMRSFVIGVNPIECRDESDDDFKKNIRKTFLNTPNVFYNVFFGIANAVFASVVASFTNVITQKTDTTVAKKQNPFCVERIEDAIFGLYDTYDATDEIIQFIVYNTTLALNSNDKFREKFGFYEQPQLNNRKNKDNLLTIFRWMMRHREDRYRNVDEYFRNNIIECINKMDLLLDYVSFCKNISWRAANDGSKSIDVVFHNNLGDQIYPSNYILMQHDYIYMLRSVETNQNVVNDEITLHYSHGYGHELVVSKSAWEMFKKGSRLESKEEKGIPVDSVGMAYNKITYGLLRKRSRASFCGGLSGFKYYSELASAIIDALEVSLKDRNKVIEYLYPVIKSNFSICKDECVCIGTHCPFIKKGEEKKCNESKKFDIDDNLEPECISNMRLLPIVTILLAVSGCKAIIPQILSQKCSEISASKKELIDEINNQLKKRFPSFNSEKINQETENIYNKSLASFSFSVGEDVTQSDLPNAVIELIGMLQAKAYAEAVILELESIENEEDRRKKLQSLNVNSLNLKEKIETIKQFGLSDEKRDVKIKYAVDSLKRALQTIVCYNEGLKNCGIAQIKYEFAISQTTKMSPKVSGPQGAINKKSFDAVIDAINEKRYALVKDMINEAFFDAAIKENRYALVKDIINAVFFAAATEKAKELKEKSLASKNIKLSFDILVRELYAQEEENANNDVDKDKISIALLLGREVINKTDFKDYVSLERDGYNLIYQAQKGNRRINIDNMDEIKNLNSYEIEKLFNKIASFMEYLFNKQSGNTMAGIYPQVLTFSNLTVNRDENIMRKFVFNGSNGVIKEYNVFTYFDYDINKNYFFMPPKKYENSNWLTHPILIDCDEFQSEVLDIEKNKE